MKALLQWLEFQRKPLRIALCIAMSVAIGLVDYFTTYEVALGVFYLFPCFLLSWVDGRRAGLWLAIWSAVLWHVADVGSGHVYSNPAYAYWNAVVRLGYFLSVTLLTASLREEQDRQFGQARIDPLTGLPNRRAFLEAAERERLRSRRGKHAVTLAYIDVDHFKAVNDQLGHSAGDELLRLIGQTLLSSARGSDAVARLGGDEFAVLLPETDAAGARRFLDALRTRLLSAMKSRRWPVTFSIGSITFSRAFTVSEMLERADALMYEVKRGSRDNIEYELTSGEFFTQASQAL